MPAEIPAEVQNLPLLTKMRSASTRTRGYRRAKSSPRDQCVVAARPSSSPVAASRYAPEQTLATRREGVPAVLSAAADKAQRELKWTPRFADLDTIVRTAWNWHQRRPHGDAPNGHP